MGKGSFPSKGLRSYLCLWCLGAGQALTVVVDSGQSVEGLRAGRLWKGMQTLALGLPKNLDGSRFHTQLSSREEL